MSKIEFKSHVPVAQKRALEALLFFNSCQERVSACIADAIEKFGAPEIVALVVCSPCPVPGRSGELLATMALTLKAALSPFAYRVFSVS